jgi:hypothetical protein
MTTTPQEPSEQEDPQTHLSHAPDRIPSAEETVHGDEAPGQGREREQLDDEAAEHESAQPGVDPDWPQQAVKG